MTRLSRAAAWLAARVLDLRDRRSATARAYNLLAEDRAAIKRVTGRPLEPVDHWGLWEREIYFARREAAGWAEE